MASDTGIVWRNRPQIRVGDDVRIQDTFDLPSARFGIAGEIGNDVEFQVEYDTQKTRHWRDVYGE